MTTRPWLEIKRELDAVKLFDATDNPELTDEMRLARYDGTLETLLAKRQELGLPHQVLELRAPYLRERDLLVLDDAAIQLTDVTHHGEYGVSVKGTDTFSGEPFERSYGRDDYVLLVQAPEQVREVATDMSPAL